MPERSQRTLRVAALPVDRPTPFELLPDAPERETIAERLGLSALRKLRFAGTLTPAGGRDWLLEGELGATVVQPCVATTEPVTTRIETAVERRYLSVMPAPEPGSEVEMHEGDELDEPLGTHVDLAGVMIEALSLALPDFPRARDEPPADTAAAPPGAAPLADEDTRPFAGLRKRLNGKDT